MRLGVTRGVVGLCLALAGSAAAAADGKWGQVGYGRLINNDFLGDLKDRDQSGSYVSSRMFARESVKSMPTRAGDVLEFRLQADIKSPDNLRNPRVGDRPYAGSLTLGLHTHYEQAGFQISMGAEVAVTGPQTRLDQFQTALHDALSVSAPSTRMLGGQIGNGFHPGVVVEMGREFQLTQRSTLRPFVEGRTGVETMIRAGFDLALGEIGREPLQVRDSITGHRYRTVLQSAPSFSFVVGADTAVVSESIYLPSVRGYTLTDTRDRARVGVHWQGAASHGFFGLTYLGKEYTSQASEQVVGSIRVSLEF